MWASLCAALGLREGAAAIPRVKVFSDVNGKNSPLFGTETSWHAVPYERDDQLPFRDEIAPSRAHECESAGERALIWLIRNETTVHLATVVFECSLVLGESK